jgi:hypothetical protein
MLGFGLLAFRVGVVALLFLITGASGAPAQQRVGVSSAVNPEASSRPPGGTVRKLVIGQEIVFNERITTEAAGQTQLLFLDESSMTIGPNSDLTIDQFVYDPKTGTGKLAMSATRGLLRYVGGKLSKQDDAVTLRTSTATLAVRGGAFIANITTTATDAVFIYGRELRITGAAGGFETVRRPGFHSITQAGGSPSASGPTPPGELAGFTQSLDGQAGRTGGAGAGNIPTDTSVANSGISGTISGNFNASLQQSTLNQGGTPNFQPNGTNFVPNTVTSQLGTIASPQAEFLFVAGGATNNITTTPNSGSFTPPADTGTPGSSTTNTTNSTANTTSSTSTTNTTTTNNTPPPPPPSPPPPPPVTLSYAGRVKSTNGNGTARGFVDQTANGDRAYSSGTLTFPPGSPQSGVFTATISNNLGTIRFPLVPGSASFQGTSSGLGALTGTSFLSADGTFFYANITPTSQPTQRLTISGGMPANSTAFQQTGSTRIFAFSVQPDAALQSNIPFLRGQTGGNLPNATVSPLYVVAPPTTPIGDSTTLSAARALQASLAISGQGANQQSAIAVTTGTIDALQSNGQPILNGHLRGSSLQSAGGTPVRVGSTIASTVDGAGNSFYGANSISGFVLDQTQFNSTAPHSGVITTPVIPSTATETSLSGAATNYGFTQPVLPTPVAPGVGTNRTTQALVGNFGGLMYTTAQPTPYIVTGGAFIGTDAPNNRIQATLAGAAQSPSAGVNTVTMQYGSLNGTAAGREAFVDNNTFAVLESQVNPQQINGQTLVVNGDPNQAGKLYLASSGAAGTPTSILPSGVSYCQCQYLQWGYWGGDLRTGNSTDSTISRIDRGHINTWVAGVQTPLNDLNTLMNQNVTGTYTGHAIGSVFNNGQSYVAAGGFTGTYNFGTQTGSVAVNNFDGHSFAASGRAPLNGANYSFGVNSPGATGAINGTFYGPMAAETGGSFAVKTTVGPAYLASGIYAGKR